MKITHLALAVTLAPCWIALTPWHRASALEPDSPCYVRDRTGKVADLSYLCGPAPAGGRIRKVNTKTAECKQLEQALQQFVQDMDAVAKKNTPENSLQQLEKFTGIVDRHSRKINALPMRDATMITLRSRVARYLQQLGAVSQRMVAGGKTGNPQTIQDSLVALQGMMGQGDQIGTELNQYCGFKNGQTNPAGKPGKQTP